MIHPVQASDLDMAGKRKSILSRFTLIFLFLVSAAVVDLVVFFVLPLQLLYPVTFDGDGAKMETAAILFNDFNGDFTGINAETRRRLNRGIALLEKGQVKRLIVVGGNREKSERKGAEFMADYLRVQDVPPEKILVEASSRDTVSNLEELGKILAQYPATVIGLISSPYHLWRLQAMHLPLRFAIGYFSYNPSECRPPLTRSEVWFSAHYNAAAYLAHLLLPENLYRGLVHWVRNNTDW